MQRFYYEHAGDPYVVIVASGVDAKAELQANLPAGVTVYAFDEAEVTYTDVDAKNGISYPEACRTQLDLTTKQPFLVT